MLLSLPSELLLAILKYLSLEDLVKLRVVCKKLYNLVFDSYLLKHFTIYNNSRLTDLIISNILKHSSYVEFLDLFRCINIHGDFTKLIDLLKLRPLKVLNVAYTQFTNENVCTVQNVASILSKLWINDCSFMF